jgi:hypothetical protein
MADWAYYPQYDARWDLDTPPTLVTRLSDGKSIRRQKHANAPQTWQEEYWFRKTVHDTAKAIFVAKGRLTSFTKLSFDVGGTPTQEQTVYFAGPWSPQRSGDDLFVVTLTFERAY